MPDTTFKFPTDTGDLYTAWTNPTNAYADDGSVSTHTNGGSNYQDYSAFTFNIPAGATIDGIEIVIKTRNTEGAGNRLYIDQSWDGGSSWTTPDDYSAITDTTLTEYTIGGASSLFGRSWSDTDFSNTNYFARVHGGSISGNWEIDFIKIKVYYTEATTTTTTSSTTTSTTSSTTSTTSSTTSTTTSTTSSTTSTTSSSTSTTSSTTSSTTTTTSTTTSTTSSTTSSTTTSNSSTSTTSSTTTSNSSTSTTSTTSSTTTSSTTSTTTSSTSSTTTTTTTTSTTSTTTSTTNTTTSTTSTSTTSTSTSSSTSSTSTSTTSTSTTSTSTSSTSTSTSTTTFPPFLKARIELDNFKPFLDFSRDWREGR